MDSEGSRRLTTNDALLYLKEIKTVFTEDMEKSCQGFIQRHDHLLLGLNNFLPRGYEIQLPLVNEESSEPVLGIQDPTDFKNKFKNFEEKREKRAFQEQRALGLILELEKRVNMSDIKEDY
ncbi:hypothetical protein Lal_00015775 [Lupinus albus]|nr:hypothetical protein Lal_00015775 [Lupinus albus]